MLISCKCLNFIAINNGEQLSPQNKFNINGSHNSLINDPAADIKYNSTGDGTDTESQLISLLINSFLHKYPRNFIFYSPCMEFFKKAIGPIPDLIITTINQNNLIFDFTLNIVNNDDGGSRNLWQIIICINCRTALFAKRIINSNNLSTISTNAQAGDYLINADLLTTNEELLQKKSEKSFSDTFGILIIDQQQQNLNYNDHELSGTNPNDVSTAAVHYATIDDSENIRQTVIPYVNSKQTRVKSLTQNLQVRLQKEIAETDERILRYSDQQFALLKSFREKSEQEYNVLIKLINKVPEQISEMYDSDTNTLDMNRKRSTTNNRRGDNDLSTTSTPSTLSLPSNSSACAIENTQSQEQQQNRNVFVFNNRKTANFDTPPATPENIPMSIGNSPTFRQQQQQQSQPMTIVPTFYQQFPISSEDCFFELEGVENYQITESETNKSTEENHMSDLGDSDAEEAEDALSLDASIPIKYSQNNTRYQQNITNIGKSLPISIDNPSMAQRTDITNSNDDLLDDNLDIAASIKALAKSVHGEAVFGDLPRPRLRSQE